MSKTTVLKFPSPRDFFEWLKQRGIHEYGSVVMQEGKSATHGVPFITYSIRLSAKDPQRSEIVRCEVSFWNGIWIDREHSRKEAEEAEKQMQEYVKKQHEEAFKGYEIAVIPAEFDIGEEKD